MIVARRHVENITLNPYEYLTDDDGELRGFSDEDQAVKYFADHGLSVEDKTDLWSDYGIDLQELSTEEFEDVRQEIKDELKGEEE